MSVAPTSTIAYASAKPLGAKQKAVLDAIRTLGPSCDRDIAEYLGWTINRVTPRRGELVKAGKLIQTGFTVRDGRPQNVWKIP